MWPSPTAERYLGYWNDSKLTFTHHHDKAIMKVETSLKALRSLSGSTWGTSLSAMRTVYQAVIIPQMLFGVAAWYSALTTGITRANAVSSRFASVQKKATCLNGGRG